MGWFDKPEDRREAFPIENLPVETYGENRGDALRLLYNKRRNDKNGDQNSNHLPKPIGLDPAKESFFRRILPILDGFDTVFRYAEHSDIQEDKKLANWIKTVESLYRRLLSALEKEGLVAVESSGNPLDLSHHEVLESREQPNMDDNIVVEEVVKGYRYGQKVLRDAKVVVSKKGQNHIEEGS